MSFNTEAVHLMCGKAAQICRVSAERCRVDAYRSQVASAKIVPLFTGGSRRRLAAV
jgi:hypothetical protein